MAYHSTPWLVFFKRRPSALLRLYCFHYAAGSASVFRSWVDYLPATVELVGIQLPGREGRFAEDFITNFDNLIDRLVEAIKPHMDKPSVVFGHSMGSLNGFEVIRKMKELELMQPLLFIAAGRAAPQYPDKDPPISFLPEDQFVKELLKKYAKTLKPVLEKSDLKEHYMPQLRADFKLCENYQYRNGIMVDCPIVAYAGKDELDISESELQGWKANTSNWCRWNRFPGDHFFVDSARGEVLESINRELDTLLQSLGR